MNIELARNTAGAIRADDGKHWNQASWWAGGDRVIDDMPVSDLVEGKCGTTGCVAGWTVALAHPKAVFIFSQLVRLDPEDYTTTEDIALQAQADLELTDWQASWLFGANRTQEQVLWALENDDPGWDPYYAPQDDD